MKRLKTKTELLWRNGPVKKSMESVLRPEESLWYEIIVKEVDFEMGVKQRQSNGWRE